nr:PREDICTED: uncharacterized protein LOC109637555 [Paralichthys olivaceus]
MALRATWSGCSHSKERAYPAVQHGCNNVTPAPVVHPANGIQINMVAPQDPDELKVVDGPAQGQQDGAKSRQDFQSLHHKLASSGFQHPKPPGESVWTPLNSCHQLSRKANPDYISSLHVTAQYSGANENSGRQCLYNGEQDEESIHSLDALSCEQIGNQNLVLSRSTRYQQQLTCPSPVEEIKPLTDFEIHDFIVKEVKQYRRTQSTDNLPTSSDKGTQQYEEVQCVSALEKTLTVDSSKGSKLNTEFTQTSDCPTVPSKKHSTEYLQLMGTVAATRKKNEDKSPVVLISRSGMTFDELTEKEPWNKPQEECTSLGLNINRNLEELHKVAGVSWSPKHMEVKEDGDTRLKPVDNVGWTVDLDNLQGVNERQSSIITGNQSLKENQDTFPNRRKTSEDQHCHTTDQEVIAHSMGTSSVDQIQIHSVISISTDQTELLWNQASHQCVMADAGSVHSQTDLSSLEVTEKIADVQELPLLPESKSLEHAVEGLKDPKYEDISDNEMSQGMTKLPNTEHEKCSFLPCGENPQYEDISEDENPEREISFPEYNKKQSLFENEGHGHVQDQAQVKTASISDEKLILLDTAQLCSCPCFVETDDGFEHLCPKCDSDRQLGVQTNHSASCSPSYDYFKDGEESDDQMDDFIVLPICITDIIFGPDNEIQDVPEYVVQDDSNSGDEDGHGDMISTYCPAPNPVAASATYNIEVFDTVKSFLKAKAAESGRSTPEHEMVLEEDAYTPSRSEFPSEPEDSTETDDSCDYSAPLPPETDDYAPEKETEQNETTNEQKIRSSRLNMVSCMENLNKLIDAKARSKNVQPETIRQTYSKNQEIIIVDSDTEDESDQNCRTKAKRKRLLSSDSMEYGDAPWGQQTGHPSETVDSLYGTLKENADLPVPQCPELSHSTATSGQQLENKAGHKHVQQETNRRNIESVIILDSDTEDDSDQEHKEEYSRRFISSGSMNSAISSSHSPDIVDTEYGPTKEKLQEMRLSSADCPDLSLCAENGGQLIEAEVGSARLQHKSNKQATSRVFHESDKVSKKDDRISKRKATDRNPSAVPKDSRATFPEQNRQSKEIVNRLCGTGKTRPRKTIQLSIESQRKWLQSVDKKAEATSGTCPVMPQSVHNKDLKCPKERVNRQGKDETLAPNTPIATSKRKHYYEKNTLNKVQANRIKPRRVSKELSLPSQERLSATMMDILRTNYESRRQARPGPSHSARAPKHRRRHNSHESVTPLMKRTMSEAKHLTKARNREIQREQGSNVGVGYKGLESGKKVARLTKKDSASER